MAQYITTDRINRRERAILAGILHSSHDGTSEDPLEELRGLAKTADLVVVSSLLQKRDKPDVATYLGSGKVEQLKELVEANDADVVLFDNDLAPSQTRNLERAIGVKVIDRTEVILDIFARRAQTHEAHLQVELAQLEYALPRLKRMWTHLSRYKGGIGVRGPGEKQLEEDRRLVEHRIRDLKEKLSRIQKRKEREVSGRSDAATVSLVGYTNAGKSTLMNLLTGAGVLTEDKLFATLDTRTRRWPLSAGRQVLLSDTVGFIRDLPHTLVASFKATLEEARQADLLLHVVDASNPDAEQQIEAVDRVLEELSLSERPLLLVLNKVDRIRDRSYLDALMAHHSNPVLVSAATGVGLEALERAVREALDAETLDVQLRLPAKEGRILAYLTQHATIQEQRFDEDLVELRCRMPRRCVDFLRDQGVVVERVATTDEADGKPGTEPAPADPARRAWLESEAGSVRGF